MLKLVTPRTVSGERTKAIDDAVAAIDVAAQSQFDADAIEQIAATMEAASRMFDDDEEPENVASCREQR